MTIGEYLLLAVLSIFWPLLIAIVVVALRLEHPIRLLLAFLAGGLLATITVGVALVLSLDDASFMQGSRPPADPVVYFAAGALALLTAYVIRGLKPRPPRPKKQSRWSADRVLESTRLAFAAGIVLNIAPGFFPFVALKNIAELDATATTKVVLVVVFYLIMFATVEVPIVGHAVAPDRTAAAVQSFNNWLDRNGRRLGVWVLALGGIYLIVRGLLSL